MTSIASLSYRLTQSDLDDRASVSVARTDLESCSASDYDLDDIVSVASSYTKVYVDDVGRPVSEGGVPIHVRKSKVHVGSTTGHYKFTFHRHNESVVGDWDFVDGVPFSDTVEIGDPDSAVCLDPLSFYLLQFLKPLQPTPCMPFARCIG